MSRESNPFGGLSRTEGRAWGGFLRTYVELTRRLDAELREGHELPLTWYDALRQLAHSPDRRLRMTDLAERVLLTQSGLTRLVGRLESEGLVSRAPDPEDGRVTLACLTPEGYRRLAEAHPTHVTGIRRYFLAQLDEEQLEGLAEAWRRIGSNPKDDQGRHHRGTEIGGA